MIWVDGNSNLEREYCDMKDQLFQVLHEHNAGASNDLISQKGIHGIKLTQNKKKLQFIDADWKCHLPGLLWYELNLYLLLKRKN